MICPPCRAAACCADGDATFAQMHDCLTAEIDRQRERAEKAERELTDTRKALEIRRQDCDDLAEQSHGRLRRAEKAEADARRWHGRFSTALAEYTALTERHSAALDQPETPRRLTEQQGGIPNDAYGPGDHPKGM